MNPIAPNLPDPQDPVTGPTATADQIYAAASGLQASLDQLQLGDVATGDPGPVASINVRQRSVVLALGQSLLMSKDPEAAAVQQALGINPATLWGNIDVQEEAHGAALEALRFNQGAHDGRRVVGAAGVLACSLVQGEVQRQLVARDALGRDLLNAHLRPVQAAEAAEAQVSTDAQSATRLRDQQTAQSLQDVNKRAQLLQVLSALEAGQSIAWDTLVAAAQTLDQITAAQDAPAATPNTTSAAGDRRAGDR